MEANYTFEKIAKTRIGPLGRWHFFVFFLIFFMVETPFIFVPTFTLTITVPHRCAIPLLDFPDLSNVTGNVTKLTYDQITNLTIPFKENPESPPVVGQAYQPCTKYNTDWLDNLSAQMVAAMTFEELMSIKNNHDTNLTKKCDNGFQFDTRKHEHRGTTVEEFELVCEHANLVPVSTTAYMIGQLLACVITGYLSDKFGRKKVVLVATVFTYIFALVIAVSPNMLFFMSCRALLGFSIMTVWMTGWVLLAEIGNSRQRNIFLGIFNFGFGFIFVSIFLALTYFINNWRWLHVGLAVVATPSIFSLCYLPESPRWLIVSGRQDEAAKVINRAIRINRKGKELDEVELRIFTQIAIQKVTRSTVSLLSAMRIGIADLSVLFTRRILAKKSFFLGYIWFNVGLCYYGITFSSSRLAGNAYLNFWIISLTTIPATLFYYFIYTKFGRKKPLIIAVAVTAPIFLCVGLYQALEPDPTKNIPILIGTAFGQCLSDATYNMIYTFTPEIYPTEYRNYGMGTCSAISRIGSALSPFIIQLGDNVWRPLPMIIYGTSCLISAIMVTFLPETKNKPLHETLEAMEKAAEALKQNKRVNLNGLPDDLDSDESSTDKLTRQFSIE